jgi:hypothetical protein
MVIFDKTRTRYEFRRAKLAVPSLGVLPRKLPAVAMQMAVFLVCGGCHPMVRPGPVATAAIAVAAPAVAVKPRTPPVQPASPAQVPQVTRAELGGILLEGVAFDSRTARLIVADQPGGPGARWADAATATAAHGGLAGINAGFFTPEGVPLGKVVAAGVAAGSWNRTSSLGSAVWWEVAGGEPAISRREAVPAQTPARELLQAGPLLVEHGRAVSGLEATKASVRSVVLWDGGTRWWIGRASACILAELARGLAAGKPAGWPVRHALNLDGGRSADLAVTPTVAGGPLVRRTLWNRPVRNFLILVPR